MYRFLTNLKNKIMNQIKKYIERLKQLQSLYEVGQPQHNAFGIAIDEANEMLVKNCIKTDVVGQSEQLNFLINEAVEKEKNNIRQFLLDEGYELLSEKI